ncbi:PAS domain-containing protein [Bradyrhizobium sp. SYSU BS000235]|uniref:PAS domain-containing protein n=1 Tax=Bradyrhizobium sp. SYSU BS000235 TaxID=3411332 RepID=UPI003C7154F5
MLKLWDRSKRGEVLPLASAVHDEDLARLREKLLLLDVERQDGEPRYLIRYQGSDIDRMNNRNCVGLYLNDVMEPSIRERGLKTYRRVVDLRLPAFNSTVVQDENGASVQYERLLLPFTRSGDRVDQIYSIVTLYTEDNQSPFETLKNAVSRNEQP